MTQFRRGFLLRILASRRRVWSMNPIRLHIASMPIEYFSSSRTSELQITAKTPNCRSM